MRAKNHLCWCAAALALGLATEGCAQQSQRTPQSEQDVALTAAERTELGELLAEFVPNSPAPANLPITRQRWLLVQLRDLSAVAALVTESERLVVCETIGDPHLEIGDVVYLWRLGSSNNLRMRVVRNENMPNQSNPWLGQGGGGTTIVVDPMFVGKQHPNPVFKKFGLESVGQARVGSHSGGGTDHTFKMKRITRPVDSPCIDSEPMFITVPDQHPAGTHHGGHAILD